MTKEPLTFEKKIWIASVALGKNLNYETLKYSDYMYGNESQTEDVWKYVQEGKDKGLIWFYETYRQYKLYQI